MDSNNYNPIPWYTYLHISIPKVDAISKIGASDVTVQGCWVELGQHKYFVNSTVDAVAHGDVYKPVASTNRDLKNVFSSIIHNMELTSFDSSFLFSKTSLWTWLL